MSSDNYTITTQSAICRNLRVCENGYAMFVTGLVVNCIKFGSIRFTCVVNFGRLMHAAFRKQKLCEKLTNWPTLRLIFTWHCHLWNPPHEGVAWASQGDCTQEIEIVAKRSTVGKPFSVFVTCICFCNLVTSLHSGHVATPWHVIRHFSQFT